MTTPEAAAFVRYCNGWCDGYNQSQRDNFGDHIGFDAPCSRYGVKEDDWRDWDRLAAVHAEANGDSPEDTLDGCISLIVNDSDGPAETIHDCWCGLVKSVGRVLGITKAQVKGLIYR